MMKTVASALGAQCPAGILGRAGVLSLAGVLCLAGVTALHGGQPPAEEIEKTLDNHATGEAGAWGLGGTDLTFKAALREVWIVDAHTDSTPSRAASYVHAFSLREPGGLLRPPRRIDLRVPEELAAARVLGIAEVPHGQFRGLNLVLVDPSFAAPDPAAPAPHLGILDDQGAPLSGFTFAPATSLEPGAVLTSIDVHPEREEIVAYDAANHGFYLLDFSFAAVSPRVPLLGSPSFFGSGRWALGRGAVRGAGMGIAYDGPGAVLATSTFAGPFVSHLALRYALGADGAVYTAQAFDLTPPGGGPRSDRAFVALDTATGPGGETLLVAHNFATDALHAFRAEPGAHAAPVEGLLCFGGDEEGEVRLEWRSPAVEGADSIHILENGGTVATLGPAATSYTLPRPLLGKAFLEVVTQSDGLLSSLRPLCHAENTRTPRLPDVSRDSVELANIAPLAGIAVTPLPASPEAFRGYAVGLNSNAVSVFNHRLEVLETLQLLPPVGQSGSNVAAIGAALVDLDGEQHLALLDPDGPAGSGAPLAMIHRLHGDARGELRHLIDPVDLAGLEPRPVLFDWDAGPDGNLVAGGRLPDGDFVLVRIIFERATLRLRATQMARVPQRFLTPSAALPITGIGVAVLPSGLLLVAGSDGFSRTYTEALLATPFCDSGPCEEGRAPRFVGYAQGLRHVFAPHGIGPRSISGLATAFVPVGEGAEGVGVTYLPTGSPVLLRNEASGASLTVQADVLFHDENDCSHPDLRAEQLLAEERTVGAQSEHRIPDLRPSFAGAAPASDYYVYAVNRSAAERVQITLETLLDGATAAVDEAVLPPGRHFRRAFPRSDARRVAVRILNRSGHDAALGLLVGVKGVVTGGAPPTFRRGDCDGSGRVELTDAVFGLNWLFLEGPEPGCPDACDTDDGATIDLTDLVNVLNWLFLEGRPPAPPGPLRCGADPAPSDALAACDGACR
jgi:hypothetical protein